MGKINKFIINEEELNSRPYVVVVSSISNLVDDVHFSESDLDYYLNLGANYAEYVKIKPNQDVMYILIEGRSFFEDQESFYNGRISSKLFQWAEEGKCIALIIKPCYINTSSRRHLKKIIIETAEKTKQFNVFWIATDDEMLEDGLELKDIIGSPDYFIVNS